MTNAKSRPWLFRTYAGHSTAGASNALFRNNLSKGQTGLSVAFDLPTQTGYDSDHILARGEVGKVGVPISHIGDMRTLFDQIPLAEMNTSMTINATAPWLLALYIAVAEEQGAARADLRGTVQNDIIKEYLSRGTYIFPPQQSLAMIADLARFTVDQMPKWNPMNISSYHLQEAGARPEQELSFALSTAIAVLDELRPAIAHADFERVVGSISFFVNAGMQFITETCKMRAFVELWDEICLERYQVQDAKMRRFRYGVQVNSLGLTEQQPENNVYRILISMLGVTLSKNARARAVQLPAWNEALGLPREWDQQWSLRMQQIMALETDLLAFGDIFDGNAEIEATTESLKQRARALLDDILAQGGAVNAIPYMKEALVNANAERIAKIESGETVLVGVNAYTNTESSPLTTGDGSILTVDPQVEGEQIAALTHWRSTRDQASVDAALARLRAAALGDGSIMDASIIAAKAGVTTGEWADAFREVYGEYRAPTGVTRERRNAHNVGNELQEAVERFIAKNGRAPRILIGKPGLDGHSNGAEQLAVRARDAGFEVGYGGIRMTPSAILEQARETAPDAIGLSILSGSHISIMNDLMASLKSSDLKDTPIYAGGIIPAEDANALTKIGVKGVFTPKDFDIDAIFQTILAEIT